MNAREIARRAQLGKLLRLMYYAPLGRIRNSVRCGGPIQQLRTEWGRREMEAAACRLPPLRPRPGSGQCVWFLSGERYWYQTLFCFYSLHETSHTALVPVVLDDGSLHEEHVSALQRVVPWLRLVRRPEIEGRLDDFLPERSFPTLRERRLAYPHLRKLTDVHAGERGWKLVLDSDMLFFSRPDVILTWLHDPRSPFHMVDAVESYGYARPAMEELAGAPIAERVNVGIFGYLSDAIDWERLEHWCRTLMQREGPQYLQEQALSAMLVAGKCCTVAPAAEYLTLPSAAEARRPIAAMHHYVAESKRGYFQHGWRHVAASAGILTEPAGTGAGR